MGKGGCWVVFWLVLVGCLWLWGGVMAQVTGTLSGQVVDDKGQPLPFATVIVKRGGVTVAGTEADMDGKYTVRYLDPGTYTVEFHMSGFQSVIKQNVHIYPEKITFVDVRLKPMTEELAPTVIEVEKRPLFEKDQTTTQQALVREEIEALPTRNTQQMAALAAQTFQSREGGELNIKGQRTTANVYYIDGVKVVGSLNLPKTALEQVSVITGGVPAKYGDATGGIISIQTRGATPFWSGGVELVTSEFLDPYGYNLANLMVSGPLVFRGEGDKKRPILGVFFAGEFNYQRDASPSFNNWKVKDSVYEIITQQPLFRTEEGTIAKRVETLTEDAFEPIKARLNNHRRYLSLAAKFDFAPTQRTTLTAGGSFNYDWGRAYVHRYSLFNWDNHPFTSDFTWRAFARLTQKFEPQKGKGEEGGTSVIEAFSYSLQVDYSQDISRQMDYHHRLEPFRYGYIGRFVTRRLPVYLPGVDSATGFSSHAIFAGYADTAVDFTPASDLYGGERFNPLLERITENYYELAREKPTSIGRILLDPAIANGERTLSDYTSYSIWYIPGRQFGGYGFSRSDQFRLWFNASVEIKGHSIEFGTEYEQRVQRYYFLSAASLWTLGRLLLNRHLTRLNLADPILVIDGREYRWSVYRQLPPDQRPPFDPTSDTIRYEIAYNAAEQAYFDKKVREKLGLPANSTVTIDMDSLPWEFFSVDMFVPDEFFTGGDFLVYYYGYDYLGNIDRSNPSFKDFFTLKDGEIYRRPIPAYRPIYNAFYVQDKFEFRDLIFNIGIRVDRFDANQKVLKDKYLLLPAYTAGEVSGSLNPTGAHPSNISSDYVVYVDDASVPTRIVGYRKGDKWYDHNGNEIDDPGVLAVQTRTGTIQPYLKHPQVTEKDPEYDPDEVFTDYTPQWTVMPRVAFAFPISDEANFYAHYDVLTMRPTGGTNIVTPLDWMFLRERAVDVIMGNPALKPEKTIDYEVGFKQKVGRNAAIGISAFYREMRDMIQVARVSYAYPVDYKTFDNIDFGTVKGLSFSLDMRRVYNIKLIANYTLQFAEGTGSSFLSQGNLVAFGEPNLRAILPLDYDQRHTINVVLDYRLPSGSDYRGPRLGNFGIFEAFGANVVISTGSGTPFSLQGVATREAQLGVADRSFLKGGVNQARKPWTFRADIKVDKTFNVKVAKIEHDGQQLSVALPVTVYLWSENFLNIKNVVSVWRYTGSPSDDGYISSPQGQQDVAQQQYPRAFVDQYLLFVDHPDNYGVPRRIRLGVQIPLTPTLIK